jgi:GNAT superfamily N-acetyltransferase
MLRDGFRIRVRAFTPYDRDALDQAASSASPLCLDRRFFVAKREFSEREKTFFMNVAFINHVALLALAEDGGQSVIVGGGRYVVVQPPGKAKVAFMVVDNYQGRGVGTAVMKHLATIARSGASGS